MKGMILAEFKNNDDNCCDYYVDEHLFLYRVLRTDEMKYIPEYREIYDKENNGIYLRAIDSIEVAQKHVEKIWQCAKHICDRVI